MGKGDGFEREMSRFLSLWWTDGRRDDVFWRTSASGSRATSRASAFKRTKYEHGDITFTDPDAKPMLDLMIIEAKRGYTNTSKPIKSSDMMKLCSMAAKSGDQQKIKGAVQRLFSSTKKQGGVDVLAAIDSKMGKSRQMLLQWIAKGEMDRAQAGVPFFLLIGRRDGSNAFVLLPNELHTLLVGWQNVPPLDCHVIFMWYQSRYFIASCDSYFQWLKPETIKVVAERSQARRFKA